MLRFPSDEPDLKMERSSEDEFLAFGRNFQSDITLRYSTVISFECREISQSARKGRKFVSVPVDRSDDRLTDRLTDDCARKAAR